jgi:hypothetical protein
MKRCLTKRRGREKEEREREREREREKRDATATAASNGGNGQGDPFAGIPDPGRNNEGTLPVGGRARFRYREKGIAVESAGIFPS